MIFGMSIYQLLWYFLFYSFAGWVIEVIFHAVVQGKIINRGFLNGPVCPIYGFGVISVFVLVYFIGNGGEQMVEDVPLWELFIGGTLLATTIELVGGFLLDKLCHARWWDYSDKPFNLHGYICLEFSLIWGFCITFVLRVVQPYIRTASTASIPTRIGIPLLILFYSLYLVDFIVTVISVSRLNKKLKEIDQVRHSLRVVSDGLTDVIGTGAYKTMEILDTEKQKAEQGAKRIKEDAEQEAAKLRGTAAAATVRLEAGAKGIKGSIQDAAENRKDRVEQRIQEAYASILKERYFGMGRLLRSNPSMKHREYAGIVRELQSRIEHENLKG